MKADTTRQAAHLSDCVRYIDHQKEQTGTRSNQGVLSVQRLSSTNKKLIDLRLCAAIFEGGLSFNTFDPSKPAMSEFLRSLNASYKAPSRKDIGGRFLDEVYAQRKERVLRIMEGIQHLNFAVDESDSIRKDRIFNLSLNLMDNGVYHLKSLCTGSDTHNAENISRIVVEQLNEWTGGNLQKVNSVATDTCNTMRSMHEILCRRPELSHVFFTLCDSHGLQLLIKDILQLPWFKEVMQKVTRVVTAFRKSPLQLAILREYQQKEYGRYRAFILRYI